MAAVMVALAHGRHKWHGRHGERAVELRGTEAWTVELRGAVPREAVAAAAAGLPLRERSEGVEVGLLVFGMQGLGVQGLPGPRLDYAEALWRIGVQLDERPGWLGHTCDLDRPLVGVLGRALIRYPVRRARIERLDDGEQWQVEVQSGASTLRLRVRPDEDEVPPATRPRPVVVVQGERLYRVPWQEEPAPWRYAASVEVDDGLGAVTLGGAVRWERRAVVHRGRIHRCGLATRWRPEST